MGDLKHARRRRAEGARICAALESGQMKASEAILRPPNGVLRYEIFALLRRCKGIGRRKAQHCLEHAGVFAGTRLCDLTPQERQRVVDALPAKQR